MTGEVLRFDEKLGYGFIRPSEGHGTVFVHYKQIRKLGFKSLAPGELVRYELGEHGGRPCAVDVLPLEDGEG